MLAGCSKPEGPKSTGNGAPIRIGVVTSLTKIPVVGNGYRHGVELFIEQANARGGVLGRKLEAVVRDDMADPGTALRVAEELVRRDSVFAVTGPFLDNVTMALSEFARQNKVLFVNGYGATDQLTQEKQHAYAFIVQHGLTFWTGALAQEAAKLPAKRWATIAPNYVFGRDTVEAFRRQLKALRPDVEFVAEAWPATLKIDAGATLQALSRGKPEAVFSVLFGSDLAQLVREGGKRDFFADKTVINVNLGLPEEMNALGADSPGGWICNGYPWQFIEGAEHHAFVAAYENKYNQPPNFSALVGYVATQFLIAGIEKAGAVESERVIRALEGLSVPSPVGSLLMRARDHRSTLGVWVGRTAVHDGHGVMRDWKYVSGEQ